MKKILVAFIMLFSISFVAIAQTQKDTLSYTKAAFEAKLGEIDQKLNKADTTLINTKLNLKADKTSLNALSTRISNDSLNLKSSYYNITQSKALAHDTLQNARSEWTAADNLKANLDSPTFTGHVNLPASIQIGNIDSTELSYLNNLTGNVQLKLNEKATITSLNTVESNLTTAVNQKLDYNISGYDPVGSNDLSLGSMPVYLEAGEVVKIKPSEMPASVPTKEYVGTVTNNMYSSVEVDALLNNISVNYNNEITKLRDTNIVYRDEINELRNLINSTANPFPSTPTLLTASAVSSSQINVSFTGSISSHDSTRLEYRLSGDASYSVLTTLDSGVTTYSHTGLIDNTTYEYRARAFKYVSGVPIYSGYSNSDTATTHQQSINYLFYVDNESGDNTQYDGVTNVSPSTFTITTDSKYSGSYGAKVEPDSGSITAYGYVNYASTSEQWERYKIYVPSTFFVGGSFKNVYNIAITDGTNNLLRFGFGGDGSGNPIRWVYTMSDNTGTPSANSTTNFSTNAWHLIEVHRKVNGSVGGYEIWVDSTSIYSDFARNVSVNSTQSRLGVPSVTSGTDFNDTNYFYVDDWAGSTEGRVTWSSSGTSGGESVNNSFFLSNTASGNGTGVGGWTNAALYSSFNFGQVQNGDNVYLDGGTDSLEYPTGLNITGSGISGNHKTVTKGLTAGHNGRVLFKPVSGSVLNLNANNYWTFKNFEIHSPSDNLSDVIFTDNAKLNIFDSLTIVTNGRGIQIDDATDTVIVSNCNIQTSSYSTAQTDCIYFQRNTGLVILRDNYLVVNNTEPNGHNDVIQFYNCGSSSNTTKVYAKIYNNFMWQNNTKQSNSSIMMPTYSYGWYYYYNNICVSPSSWVMQLGAQQNPNGSTNMKVLIANNVLIAGSIEDKSIYFRYFEAGDTAIVKNNIIYSAYQYGSCTIADDDYDGDGTGGTYIFNNNSYYSSNVLWNPQYVAKFNGSWKTLSDWQALGYDGLGKNTIINFTNITGFPSWTEGTTDLNITSGNGVDDGADLSTYFTIDKNNATRTGTWDRGIFNK